MGVKEFLKPNKAKIVISLLLLGISLVISIVPIYMIPFYFGMILIYNIPVQFIIITFILVSYPLGCYTGRNRRWLKGIIIYIVAFLILSTAVYFAAGLYNNTLGSYCIRDSDCIYTCAQGVVNRNYVPLRHPFALYTCLFNTVGICENNRCEAFNIERAESLEDCERVYHELFGPMCYHQLALKLNDISICNSIGNKQIREQCIEQFE